MVDKGIFLVIFFCSYQSIDMVVEFYGLNRIVTKLRWILPPSLVNDISTFTTFVFSAINLDFVGQYFDA